MPEKTRMLVDAEHYLKTGSHIGTRFKSGDMNKYIYKVRRDGLKVLNVETVNERILVAATFLAGFAPEKIVSVSRKLYGQTPAKKFAEAIGGKSLTGRFVPGTLTNASSKGFVEAEVVIATEPEPDFQAISEATKIRVPVIALCSTNNSCKDVDLVIPINNKGRKSLALAYWLLAREYLLAKGMIKSESEFTFKEEDFEYQMVEGQPREEDFYERPQKNQRGKKGQQRRGGRGFGRDRERRGRRDEEY